MTFGVWLQCDPDDLRRQRNGAASIPDAVFEILCFFFNANSSSDAEKWSMVKEAVEEVNLASAINECGIDRLLREAQSLEMGGNSTV